MSTFRCTANETHSQFIALISIALHSLAGCAIVPASRGKLLLLLPLLHSLIWFSCIDVTSFFIFISNFFGSLPPFELPLFSSFSVRQLLHYLVRLFPHFSWTFFIRIKLMFGHLAIPVFGRRWRNEMMMTPNKRKCRRWMRSKQAHKLIGKATVNLMAVLPQTRERRSNGKKKSNVNRDHGWRGVYLQQRTFLWRGKWKRCC